METFENAGYTDQNKDYPYYAGFLVERSDVTDQDSSDPAKLKWQELQVLTELEKTRKWSVVAPEIVDPNLTREELTFPLGPLLARNWGKDVAHPKIPMLDASMLMQGMVAGEGGGGTGTIPDAINYEDPDAISDLERMRK